MVVSESENIHRVQFSESFDTQGPLVPEQVKRLFPLMLRIISQPGKPLEVFNLEPQPGEHHRFGVYFWALRDVSLLNGFTLGNRFPLLLKTEDLFDCCDIDSNLLSKGIVIDPSGYYMWLQGEISRQRRRENPGDDPQSIKFNYAVERNIAESHIVLDLRPTRIEGLHPILSIPCNLHIGKGSLLEKCFQDVS